MQAIKVSKFLWFISVIALFVVLLFCYGSLDPGLPVYFEPSNMIDREVVFTDRTPFIYSFGGVFAVFALVFLLGSTSFIERYKRSIKARGSALLKRLIVWVHLLAIAVNIQLILLSVIFVGATISESYFSGYKVFMWLGPILFLSLLCGLGWVVSTKEKPENIPA